MTAAVVVETKVCASERCGAVFEREPGQSDTSWTLTQFCSQTCRPGRRRPSGVIDPAAVKDAAAVLATAVLLPGGWAEFAVCGNGKDPDVFFPVSTSGPEHERQVAAAKAVCAECPVRAECLAEAMRAGRAAEGIWGGTTREEREAAGKNRVGRRAA